MANFQKLRKIGGKKHGWVTAEDTPGVVLGYNARVRSHTKTLRAALAVTGLFCSPIETNRFPSGQGL